MITDQWATAGPSSKRAPTVTSDSDLSWLRCAHLGRVLLPLVDQDPSRRAGGATPFAFTARASTCPRTPCRCSVRDSVPVHLCRRAGRLFCPVQPTAQRWRGM